MLMNAGKSDLKTLRFKALATVEEHDLHFFLQESLTASKSVRDDQLLGVLYPHSLDIV